MAHSLCLVYLVIYLPLQPAGGSNGQLYSFAWQLSEGFINILDH